MKKNHPGIIQMIDDILDPENGGGGGGGGGGGTGGGTGGDTQTDPKPAGLPREGADD